MNDYPTLRFLERNGGWLSVVAALLPVAATIVATGLGATPWWVAGGIAVGAFVYLAARSYIELIHLMTDMLLPK